MQSSADVEVKDQVNGSCSEEAIQYFTIFLYAEVSDNIPLKNMFNHLSFSSLNNGSVITLNFFLSVSVYLVYFLFCSKDMYTSNAAIKSISDIDVMFRFSEGKHSYLLDDFPRYFSSFSNNKTLI